MRDRLIRILPQGTHVMSCLGPLLQPTGDSTTLSFQRQISPLWHWWYNPANMQGQATIHVGLNAHLFSQQAGYRKGGIHNYIEQLIEHLPVADASLKITVFTGALSENNRQIGNGLDWRVTRWPTNRPAVRVAWEQLVQPWALVRAGVQLLHALAFVTPLLTLTPAVVTVHDLSFLRFPERFRPLNRLYLSAMTRLSCRRARRIIAVSQATAQEIAHWLSVPSERIDVVPHGVQHARFRPLSRDRVAAFRREKGLPERFVLYVGTLEPRKNLVTLIEALAHVRAVQSDVRLVIAGGKGWYFQEVFRRVEELDLQEVVHFAGFVPGAELPLWYNAATLFVYPSLYEGFGLPLLEAMACGTPVIGSDASSMPEVIGDAGVLVASQDVEGMAEALLRLLNDGDCRVDLGRMGQARAATFTWEAAAAATADSYRRALAIGLE